MFALDATASREPTWGIARDLQARMFREAAPIGQLDVQLVFYRGDECRVSKWGSSGEQLAQLTNRIECIAGYTQIGKVMAHACRQADKAPVHALVFIRDAMEEEIATLAAAASELGARRVPMFLFQEGRDVSVRRAFRLLALKSGGAYFEFNPDKAQAIERLSDQLNAVARLAVGDTRALDAVGSTLALTDQRG
jgi:hypothetical protein